MKNNEGGMTLVEVIATLSLVSLVGILIWTTLFISSKQNTSATTKLRLQQEANYILTELQTIHRQKDCYELSIEDNIVTVKNCEDASEFMDTISTGYHYERVINPESGVNLEIEPESNDLPLNFKISDPVNRKLEVNVETVISRYKSID